jgi:glucose/arabinose dehydrogenase
MKRTWMLALLAVAPTFALAQINAGTLAPTADKPFTVTKVAPFSAPWRIAFLPDGRMLITEKAGKVFLATRDGAKTEVTGVPTVQFGGQNGLLGIYRSPTYEKDHDIYLTYNEPGEDPATSALALAHARLDPGSATPALSGLKVIWRDPIYGKGGQTGGAVAFSPDGKLLYLTAGDRQRFTTAQDPNQPSGKILRLTLDGKPAPGNPMEGKTGANTVGVIDPPKNSEAAKTAPVVRTYTFTTPNLTPAETWSIGHRTPYGLAFAPDGRLWEVEHGPRGGDELNLIEPGKNYGWPLVCYAGNYDGVPIDSPDIRADLAKPAIYWAPVIAPGNLMFYSGDLFPQWKGSALISGMGTATLNRIIIEGASAKLAERWAIGFRVRDVAQGPDGALWLLEDSPTGGLYRLAPK